MADQVKITWLDSISGAATHTKIFRDDVEIGQVARGVQVFYDKTIESGKTYKYEVQAFGPAGVTTKEVLGVNVIAVTTAGGATTTPVLTNFRVKAGEPSRIYFDTPNREPVGLSIQGFVLSDNNIVGVNSSSKYFTVANPYDFWSNSLISLSGGNGVVNDFEKQRVHNFLAEPVSQVNKYVSASGSGDGSSEVNAASLTYAMANAAAGETWWCKAGNYGAFDSLTPTTNGTEANPIKFIGYKNIIGDITSMYYSYGDGALDSNEMPTSINPRTNVSFWKPTSRKNVIIRNFQVQGYGAAFYLPECENAIVDMCIAKDNLGTSGYGFVSLTSGDRLRFTNGISTNGLSTMWLLANNSLIENLKCYGDDSYDTSVEGSVNYYYAIAGDDNIIINNYAERKVGLLHYGHGASIHSINVSSCRRNLLENHSTKDITKSIELRHGVISDNTVRGCTNFGTQTGGILIRDGAYNNVIEDSVFTASQLGGALQLVDSVETGEGMGVNNTIKNCLFNQMNFSAQMITADAIAGTSICDQMKIYNCTFLNSDILFNFSNRANYTFTNCEFKNNIFQNINYESVGGDTTGWSYDGNNFYEGFAAKGTNTTIVNPSLDTNNVPTAALNTIDVASLPSVRTDYGIAERNASRTTRGYKMHEEEVGGGDWPNVSEIYPQDNAASKNEVNAVGTGLTVGAVCTVESSGAQASDGSYSLLTTSIAGGGVSYAAFTFPTEVGGVYRISMDYRGGTLGTNSQIKIYNYSSSTNGTEQNVTDNTQWTSWSTDITASDTTIFYWILPNQGTNSAGAEIYIDNITITKIS